VPPLRSRPEDVTLLAASFAAEIAARLGRATPAFSPACQSEMAAYAWPGNVRELRNVIERAIILNPRDVVESLDLGAPELLIHTAGEERVSETNLRAALMAREREVVIEALKRSGGVRKEAARLLGIDQRNLGYYLRKHTIDAEQVGE
jgi:DNA-binding NtrC family response regulator